MTAPSVDDYLKSVYADDKSKRRYAQNSLIVDVAVALNKGLSVAGMSQKALAERLGKTEGFVSQVLSGGSNITIRTLGDFAYAMNCVVDVVLRQQAAVVSEWTYNTEAAVIAPTGISRGANTDVSGSRNESRGSEAEGLPGTGMDQRVKDEGLQRFKAEELDRLHLKLFGFARPKTRTKDVA